MNQENFGKIIKDIRKKYGLTQKQLAEKYNVSYQAVSKWENGLNMPDISLIKEISKDFNISLDEMLGNKKNTNKIKYIAIILGVGILIASFLLLVFKKDDFQFKTIDTSCNNFNVSGNISYNQNKTAIHISNIEYCGNDDNNLYKEIECILYESNNGYEKKISEYKGQKNNATLDEFLKEIKLVIDNYETSCKSYQDNNLYLSINALSKDNKTINYKIPLKLNNCNELK